MLQWLIEVSAPWNTLYADSTLVSTGLLFIHLAAILVGGGAAMAADRRLLKVLAAADLRRAYLESSAAVHRTVVGAITVVLAAGILLFLADVESLAGSVVFRVKLILIFLLLSNGVIIVKVERRLLAATQKTPDDSHWRRLGVTARVSMTLWLCTLLAGVALRNG